MNTKTKVIAIAGATASGKTKFAVELAHKINGEIISADSRQVYKGFEIAVAKPSIEEREGIKHYLLDVVEPEVDYSVANFCDDAEKAIEKIVAKGKIPIVAGGTGLYFRILLEDYDLPRVEPDYAYREELETMNSEKLYEMLKIKDSLTAEKVHFNNKRKIIRALEVCNNLGKPISEAAGKKECKYDVEWIGINVDRAVLYERINTRIDVMIKNGLLEETERLLEKHGRINNFVKTIGYQEMLAYLDGEATFDDAIERLKQNTRRYAKRQLTWFRRNPLLNID